MTDSITPQSRPLGVLVISLHEHRLRKFFYMVDTISNMQFAKLDYKPCGGQILRDIIDCVIGARFYPPPGSYHHKILCLDELRGTTHQKVHLRDNPDAK